MSKDYPAGRGALQERYIKDTLVQFGIAKMLRTRLTVALINTGTDLLAALPGVKWRLLDFSMIAIGGAAGTATSVNLEGTSAAAGVHLAVVAIAALTRSAVVRAGAANAVVLADGASFVAMDANTAIQGKTAGSALDTATHIDFFLNYVADAA